jgi:lambda repressor-like predicted transcriptional regulator
MCYSKRRRRKSRTMRIELALYNSGFSIAEISRQRGISRYLVAQRLKEQGYLSRGRKLPNPLAEVSDKQMLDLYSSGLSVRAIAEILRVPFTTVAVRLRGIPGYSPRPKGFPPGHSRHPSAASSPEEPMSTVSFRIEESIIKLIESLPSWASKSDFYRAAIKEKLAKEGVCLDGNIFLSGKP